MLEICFLGILIPIVIYIYIILYTRKYRIVDNKKELSGFEVANKILTAYDIEDVYIVEGKNIKYNVYTSDKKNIKFSKKDFHGENLASLAFSAMESIHILQYNEKNNLIKLRNDLMKIVEMICYSAYIILLYGLLVNASNLIVFSLAMFIIVLLFHLFTYSVEKEAKEKALKELLKLKLIDKGEKEDVEKLLNVYSLNYFASVVTVLIKLVNLIK